MEGNGVISGKSSCAFTVNHTTRLTQLHLAGRGSSAPAFMTDGKNHRASFVILLLFILFVLSVSKYDITGVIVYAVLPVLLVTTGRLSLKPILTRLTILSPFIIVMAAANPLFDWAPCASIGPFSLSCGMVSGAVILLKSLVTITVLLAFSWCVPFFRICEVLRGFRVPDLFVTQLSLLYRYSFLLVDEAMAMQKARNSRSFGNKGTDILTTAKLIGSLLLRTHDKAGRIYREWSPRGFGGTLAVATRQGVEKREILPFSVLLFPVIKNRPDFFATCTEFSMIENRLFDSILRNGWHAVMLAIEW
ncbi:MAG: hypothetical protein JW795_08970 [Chitinivibrionales bacterium]|nr:hypothetical protein [Chitinivibrionales bacterium]